MGPTDHSFRSLSRLLLTRFRFHRARFVVSLTAIAILLFYLSTQHSPVPLSYSPSPSSLAIFSRGELPRATIGQNITFPTYLNYHFPLPSRLSSISGRARAAQRIWLTVSDEQWIDVTAGMQVFIDKLNVERDVINQVGLSETVLVVLCVDEGCMRRCREKAMYCYGGFEYTRPKKILPSVWPKLAGVIEILKHRKDVFYVDSDVFFRADPYPTMEPLFGSYDFIASENDVHDHINTGFFWIRSCRAAVHAWQEVLAMNMRESGRDQAYLNKVLDTAKNREWRDASRRPPRDDFVTLGGLRTKVLDSGLFRAQHFELTRPTSDRHQSVFLHMTCGDDMLTRVFMAQSEGFWGDVDSYYSKPPRILTVHSMSGHRASLEQLLRVLLTISHFSGRHFRPPTHTVVQDLTVKGINPQLAIYKTFPIARIASAVKVPLVEPSYIAHATRFLLQSTISDRSDIINDLNNEVDLDIRTVSSLLDLIHKLRSPSFAASHVVRIIGTEVLPLAWEQWVLPATADGVKTCRKLDDAPSCIQVCKYKDENGVGIEVSEPWVSLKDLEGGWTRGRPRNEVILQTDVEPLAGP